MRRRPVSIRYGALVIVSGAMVNRDETTYSSANQPTRGLMGSSMGGQWLTSRHYSESRILCSEGCTTLQWSLSLPCSLMGRQIPTTVWPASKRTYKRTQMSRQRLDQD